jgi:arginine/lysine/ornithine decarboxylase
MLHLSRESLLDAGRVSGAVRLLQTSSPSYILLASLDAARRQLALKGREMLERLLEVAADVRAKLSEIPGMEVFGPDQADGDGVFAFDPCRVVVKVSGAGLTGWQAASWLAGKHGLYVEMADRDNIVLVLGPGITVEDCRELAPALWDMLRREGGRPLPPSAGCGALPRPAAVMGLREAWFANSRPVRLEQAVGLACGEWVAVYPPGLPVILPGEEVSGAVVNYLTEARESGAGFQGPADPEMRYIRVIDS